MRFAEALLLCSYVLAVFMNQVAVADSEDKSEEGGISSETTSPGHNESFSEGPPDSHEAMNNRQIAAPPKTTPRDKRSYEFLMGLVNNNSKYEVTRVDPSVTTQRPFVYREQETDSANNNVTASELLLELLVKIAAHPKHWEKVHKLLNKIDDDLATSRKLLDELGAAKIPQEPAARIDVQKKETPQNKTWPSFQGEKTSFPQPSPKGAKTFAYHRVTGRPLYLNKKPKAYIAVSVIAPKPVNSRSNINDHNNNFEDGVNLEKELRGLKPWTHNQNLKNMASIRSRWLIQSDRNNNRESGMNNTP